MFRIDVYKRNTITKYGKSKKLDSALEFLESKYKELHELLEPLQKDLK